MSGQVNSKIRLKFYEKTKQWCHRAVIEGYQKLKINGIDYKEMEEEDISKDLCEEMKKLEFVKERQISIVPEFRLYGKKYSAKTSSAKKADRIDFIFSKWKQKIELEYFGEAKNISLNTWKKTTTSTVDASYYRGRYIDTGIKNIISGSYSLLECFLIAYTVNGSANDNVNALNRLIAKRGLAPELTTLKKKPIHGYPKCYYSNNLKGGKPIILQHIFLEFDHSM